MRSLGIFLIVMGAGSYVLPLLGMQFRLVQLFGKTPWVGAGFIGVGVVLFLIGMMVDALRGPKQKAAVPPPAPMPRVPRAAHAASAPPPASFDDRTMQRCGRCGAVESIHARFCGNCGAPLGAPAGVAPPSYSTPPAVPTSSSAVGCLIATILTVLLLAGGGAVGFWYWWKPRAAANSSTPTVQQPVDQTTRNSPGLPVPKPDRESAATFLSRSATLMSSGQYRNAVQELNNGLAQHPADVSLLKARAIANLHATDYMAAVSDYRAVVSAVPNDLEARCELLKLRLNLEPPPNVLPEAQQVYAQQSSDPRAMLLLAQTKLWCNDTATAQQMFTQLARIDPQAGARLAASGRDWLNKGVYAAANLDLCSAMWLNPADADTCFNLGQARACLGAKSQGIEAFERYLQLAPNGPRAAAAREQIESLRR